MSVTKFFLPLLLKIKVKMKFSVFGRTALALLTLSVFFADSFGIELVKPTRINIESNDQVTLVMSKLDINRIFVENDKISAVNAPAGYFSAHNDNSGSVYANINQERPFTVFFRTENGKFFSILIIPKNEPGKTIQFIFDRHVMNPNLEPIDKKRIRNREEENDLNYVKIIREVYAGKIPHGFKEKKLERYKEIQNEKFIFSESKFQGIKIILNSLMISKNIMIKTYDVINTSDKEVYLKEDDFTLFRVVATYLDCHTLPARSSARIIQVLRNA